MFEDWEFSQNCNEVSRTEFWKIHSYGLGNENKSQADEYTGKEVDMAFGEFVQGRQNNILPKLGSRFSRYEISKQDDFLVSNYIEVCEA